MTLREFLEHKHMETIFRVQDKIAVKEAVRKFLLSKHGERRSPLTVKSYAGILNNFLIFIGEDHDIREITSEDVGDYLLSRDDVSAKTLYNYHTCLSSFWSYAVDYAYADENVVRKLKTPKYIKRQIVPFTETEIRTLVRKVRYMRNKAILMILIDCGARASEIVNLKVEDWQLGTLKVLGKGGKERILPISPATEKLISSQLSKRRVGNEGIRGGDALFVSLQEPYSPINYPTLENMMRRLGKRTGIYDVHCHRFRHTFAINYLRNDGDIYTLQKILGHTSLDMVKTYLDIARSDITGAHAKASPVIRWGLK